jgi:hypothetical protein
MPKKQRKKACDMLTGVEKGFCLGADTFASKKKGRKVPTKKRLGSQLKELGAKRGRKIRAARTAQAKHQAKVDRRFERVSRQQPRSLPKSFEGKLDP